VRNEGGTAQVGGQPLHDLVDSQRDFADQIARMDDLQRHLADNAASWAAASRSTSTTSPGCSPRSCPRGPAERESGLSTAAET
jgi:hypothetical protein